MTEISVSMELLSDLLAHAEVLRARVDELTFLTHRTDVTLATVIDSTDRIAHRVTEVLRLARTLLGDLPQST